MQFISRFCVLFMIMIASNAVYGQDRPVIVALGDSLTAGYGLPAEDAFPAKLEKALSGRSIDAHILNAGVSGDTSKGGLERLEWSIPSEAQAVIIELGANDALRGIPVRETKKNIEKIVGRLTQRGLPVLIAAVKAPGSLGAAYVQEFADMYEGIAGQYGTLYLDDFLKDIPIKPEFVQNDGIHPTAKGVDIIVDNILPLVEQLIEKIDGRS